MNTEDRSTHVLPTASNLMGFCLIVQASLHASGYSEKTHMDEVTAVATCLFMAACLFSYLAIRARSNARRSSKYETIADVNFIAGLLILLAMVLMMVFKVMR